MPARQHRVTRGDDYRRIVRSGNRVGGALCITHAVLHVQATAANVEPASTELNSGPPARFGFIVSKAVGGAVVRNLVRRRLKAIVERRLAQGFTQADVVFRALPAIAKAPFAQIEHEVNRALDRVERMAAEQADAVRS